MADEQTKSAQSSFFSGIIIGSVLGALAALFLTEDRDQLAKDIKKKGKQILRELPKVIEDFEEKGERVSADIVEKAEEVIESSQGNEPMKSLGKKGRDLTRRFFSRSGKKI